MAQDPRALLQKVCSFLCHLHTPHHYKLRLTPTPGGQGSIRSWRRLQSFRRPGRKMGKRSRSLHTNGQRIPNAEAEYVALLQAQTHDPANPTPQLRKPARPSSARPLSSCRSFPNPMMRPTHTLRRSRCTASRIRWMRLGAWISRSTTTQGRATSAGQRRISRILRSCTSRRLATRRRQSRATSWLRAGLRAIMLRRT